VWVVSKSYVKSEKKIKCRRRDKKKNRSDTEEYSILIITPKEEEKHLGTHEKEGGRDYVCMQVIFPEQK
jgi:hypothetical protein